MTQVNLAFQAFKLFILPSFSVFFGFLVVVVVLFFLCFFLPSIHSSFLFLSFNSLSLLFCLVFFHSSYLSFCLDLSWGEKEKEN